MQNESSPTFSEILELWRSDRQVAEDLGLPSEMKWRVRQWRSSNSIPSQYLPDLARAFEARFGRFGLAISGEILMMRAAEQSAKRQARKEEVA